MPLLDFLQVKDPEIVLQADLTEGGYAAHGLRMSYRLSGQRDGPKLAELREDTYGCQGR